MKNRDSLTNEMTGEAKLAFKRFADALEDYVDSRI